MNKLNSKDQIDPAICGDDGPITPDQCAIWLDAKYRRHGELEDRAAAMWLRKLSVGYDDLGAQIYALLVRRGYSQHEAHLIASGPGCTSDCVQKGYPDINCPEHGMRTQNANAIRCIACTASIIDPALGNVCADCRRRGADQPDEDPSGYPTALRGP